MQAVISAAQMREIDRVTTERFGIPSLTLMEAAATAVARAVIECLSGDVIGKAVLVLCGRGNNGGDGATAARLLALAGAHVEVVLFGKVEDTQGDARANFDVIRRLRNGAKFAEGGQPEVLGLSLFANGPGLAAFSECNSEKEWHDLLYHELQQPHDAIVDALFGTGLTRPVAGVHREAVKFLNRLRDMRDLSQPWHAPIVSIDIPSGLNSDSAEPIGEAVHADVTITMTAPKPANVLPPAASYNGELIVADIGSPVELIDAVESKLFVAEESDARRWLIQTRYTPDSYKTTHGHALVIAGSRGFTGAAALCGNAAMRAGAGLVTVATPASSQPLVATQVMPEVMTAALAETDRGAVSDEAIDYVLKFAERANAIAIGPGLSFEDERTRHFVRALVERRKTPIVIDADALNCLAPWPPELRGSPEHPIVLTPHPGEMLRLMGTDDKRALNDRVAAARAFATEHEVIVVLKGTRSLIAVPDSRVFINPTGNAGLGTAGAGDTLTGIIAGFLAQAYGTLEQDADALSTVIAALYISGLAGDLAASELGMRTLVASDIREHLSAAIRSLDPEGEMP
ncbi:MAG TPA: NAD(P)H-hydrate dehydratase [Pyrinomonadaceae bacterium]|nr:NAD(P)H-hydrate dehydratase [Pyrinomonadaceae bacterium]